eukprot:TRINITY_DN39859_c0_g1_i1.p1 TRINITY_DN39859_c0_g1~~TRINITY_DN39859_c0_g1_i1.p1  ORF type:complete len:1096 (-),score=175.69 TRINITY_DN39859_c0_g1_i1:61-3348(-)
MGNKTSVTSTTDDLEGVYPAQKGPSRSSLSFEGIGMSPRIRSRGTAEENKAYSMQVRAMPGGGYEFEDPDGRRRKLSDESVNWFKQRNGDTLNCSRAFVPWILQASYFEGSLEEGKILVYRGSGAVVFSDASGFTALTEKLAAKSNGAELLSQCLTAFFTPLIDIITAYRGDVIKFSGDALTIYFPAVDDMEGPQQKYKLPTHGSFGFADLGPMATAVLRATACCIEIQKRLHMFDTGIDGVHLCLHIGVGCGEVAVLQVGGVEPPETHVPRSEYIIAGDPIRQISIAEPLAKNGETCLSPQAWEQVADSVIENTSRQLDEPDFHLVGRLDEAKFTFPTIKFAAMERDKRKEKSFQLPELDIIRRYVPSSVFKNIETGTLPYVNEMRMISTVFISGSGVDVSSDEGAVIAQDLMSSIQKICYANEGTLNKFVIDDKGMLFLLVFGLPPLVHTDDPTRACLACFDIIKAFQRLGLIGRCGVSTGRAYCGLCGSAVRMEYTVLGDIVNLSARLMGNAPEQGILTCEVTAKSCTTEVEFDALAEIKVKGKTNAIPIFKPLPARPPPFLGCSDDGEIVFPWYWRPVTLGVFCGKAEIKAALKTNVIQLCGLQDYKGIVRMSQILGGPFDADLHSQPALVTEDLSEKPATTPPGIWSTGGTIILSGPTGVGKVELAEHSVTFAVMNFLFVPIFGSMGPRVSDLERCGMELLRSCVSCYRRAIEKSLPEDDLEAITQLLPQQQAGQWLSTIEEAFQGSLDAAQETRVNALNALVEAAVFILEKMRKHVPIIVVLQLEYGTTLFPKTLKHFSCFWNVVSTVGKITEQAPGSKAGVVCIMCKNPDLSVPLLKAAHSKGNFLELGGLSEACCAEYLSVHLDVPQSVFPRPLLVFVAKLSLGQPLYIRETLKQMLLEGFIVVKRDEQGEAIQVDHIDDFESINIANWSGTEMVGETVCLLESLDPLEAAVVKMSTCFEGPFSMHDLAASSCSRWAGASRLDTLRLLRAVQELKSRGIIEAVNNPLAAPEKKGEVSKEIQTYEMKNVLIRKVGANMLLEAQKKKVKRQALIDRALSRDLPARMEEVQNKRMEPHIPWYYENILIRG